MLFWIMCLSRAWAVDLAEAETFVRHLNVPEFPCEQSLQQQLRFPAMSEGILRFTTDPTNYFWIVFRGLPNTFELEPVSGFEASAASPGDTTVSASNNERTGLTRFQATRFDQESRSRRRTYELRYVNSSAQPALIRIRGGITLASQEEMAAPGTHLKCR